MVTHTTARSLEDVLRHIEGALGYTPTDSLVLLPLKGNRSLGIIRAAVPQTTTAADSLVALLGKVEDITNTAVVLYTPAPFAAAAAQLALFQAAADATHSPLRDLAAVAADGWGYLDHKPAPLDTLPTRRTATAPTSAEDLLPPRDPAFAAAIEAASVEASFPNVDALLEVIEAAATDDALSAASAAALIAVLNTSRGLELALFTWARGISEARENLASLIGPHVPPAALLEAISGEGAAPSVRRLRGTLGTVLGLAANSPQVLRADVFMAAAWLAWAIGSASSAELLASAVLRLEPQHRAAGHLLLLVRFNGIPAWGFRGR